MAKPTDAWQAADGSLWQTEQRAKARDLLLLMNPGGLRSEHFSVEDATDWIIRNFDEVKKMIEQ